MALQDAPIYYPESIQQWRQWLAQNHQSTIAVWVVLYKKNAGKPTVTWSQAVDEALCFGWIDSIKKKLDEERAIQFFSKRKPKSTWSKINKQKVEHLIATGQMTPAGLACIETAKTNGSWQILDSVEELIIPEDLEMALKATENGLQFFLSLSKSVKKVHLQSLVLARLAETRQKRIAAIVALAP